MDMTAIPFYTLLLLERVQLSWFPGWVNPDDLGLAFIANPVVEWYLRHKCPGLNDWLDGVMPQVAGALFDARAVLQAEVRVLQSLNELITETRRNITAANVLCDGCMTGGHTIDIVRNLKFALVRRNVGWRTARPVPITPANPWRLYGRTHLRQRLTWRRCADSHPFSDWRTDLRAPFLVKWGSSGLIHTMRSLSEIETRLERIF
jgi:hypothetical protein